MDVAAERGDLRGVGEDGFDDLHGRLLASEPVYPRAGRRRAADVVVGRRRSDRADACQRDLGTLRPCAIVSHDHDLRPRRLSARLSRHLRDAGDGRGRPGRQGARRSRSIRPTHGALCTKVSRYPERTYHPERVLHPLRRVGAEGQRPVRAGELGRGARRHRRAADGDRRPRRRQCRGDRSLQLCRHDGPAAGREHGGALLPQARRVAARPHDLLLGRRRGARRDLRRQDRHARRALRREPPDRHLGQQLDHLEPALLDLRAGRPSAPARS